ncbi:MAG: NUDIX domain-containing protein [Candidatus Nanoarchaeia archaeon]|nr:NUDIX domain-containing protein [Candidatus Nanoarchaeia archaeon]
MKKVGNVVVAVKCKDEYLLLQRSGIETNSIFIEFPAGKVEEREEPLKAGLRELEEETGLKLTESDVSFVGITYRPKINSGKLVESTMFLAEFEEKPKIKISEEHDTFIWNNINQIKELKNLGFESTRCLNMINSNNIFNSLKKEIRKEFEANFNKDEIGIYLVGSVSRQDFLKDWSDIDVIVYFKKLDVELSDLIKLRKISMNLNKLGHQFWFKVHSPKDFPKTYSDRLVMNYFNDGKQIYGINVKDIIKKDFEAAKELIIKQGKSKNKLFEFSPRFMYRCYMTGTHTEDPTFGSVHINMKYITNTHGNELRIAKLIDLVLDTCYFLSFNKNMIPSCDKFESSSVFAFQFDNLIPFKLLRIREEEWLKDSEYLSSEKIKEVEELCFDFFENVYPKLAENE